MKSRIQALSNKVLKDSQGRVFNGQHVFPYRSPITGELSEYIVSFKDGKVHCDSAPAVRFSDGYEEYWQNGILQKISKGFGSS